MYMSLLMQAPFVHPGLAVAALAAGLIPVVIHLINRRRYKRVRWAAMQFVLKARKQSAKRARLEHWLLMAARIALVVLFGLAIARPFFPASALNPIAVTRTHHVLLIDNSLSMSALGTDGKSRFAQSRTHALDLLNALPRGDAVSVVTVAAPAEAPVAVASFDRRFVRERVNAIEATQRGTDLVGAVAHARTIMAENESAARNRVVYLFSDLPRSDLLGPGTGPDTPAIEALRDLAGDLPDSSRDFVVVAGAQAADNLAVTDLSCESRLMTIGNPQTIRVSVDNLGGRTARDVSVQLARDGRILRRAPLPPLSAGESVTVTISVTFNDTGTQLLEARIVGASGDALGTDDVRRLSLDVREAAPILLVDGQPGTTRLGGQAGYLAAALAPRMIVAHTQSDPGWLGGPPPMLAPKVITTPELDAEVLDVFGAVVLCNVQRLPAVQWKRLDQFVASGGGLMVFAGDRVDVNHYNRFGHGSGLLPGPFRYRSSTGGADGATALGEKALSHEIVRDFEGHENSGLFLARIDDYLPLTPDAGRGDVVLRYTNDDAALVAGRRGKGRVLVWTTTANMDWNNLPAKGDFVSLSVATVSWLAPARGGHRNLHVGDSIVEPLTPAQTGMPHQVRSAERGTHATSLVPRDKGLALTAGPIERAGAYDAQIGTETRRFAVNVRSDESNLDVVDEQALIDALGFPVRFVGGPEATTVTAARAGELAPATLYLVAALLFLEMWLAFRFGSRRSGRAAEVEGRKVPGMVT